MFNFIRNYLNYRKSGYKFLIDIKDYPKSKYTAYWEIGINSNNLYWEVRFYSYDNGEIVLSGFNQAEIDINQARVQSQKFVKKHINLFKRLN